ncbi:MAG: Asp-tRNA(Asn)/Glu-tRNA(Gln) amidotransferase subunit GatC [Cytophagales bacterium]|nr:Asp-tRNA(Asn)/Glu-tRNA(Gln) amidotransferase subunit GatC [Cytophagales bacterium]MDW8384737.1 Asp-tRNA(Asn)/Glu-tRNA(Gln) amidotransferase subunit GatC [Flammeovirgaceae bacterium]
MNIDKNTIEKIAHLSRLYFNEADEEKMLKSLNEILEWVQMLNKIDTTNVLPLTHMSHEVNVLREDVVEEPLPHEKALFNAPRKDSNYFRVPKVIENE